MWSARRLDTPQNIIELVWAGKIEPDEVPQANEKLRALIAELNGEPFDCLVDMTQFISFPPSTQHLIAEQQRLVIESGMRRSAVVLKSEAVKAGLNMISKKSGHTTEYHFTDKEEALRFLMSSEQ